MNEEDIKILENLKENVALFSGGWKPILKQEEKQALENLIKAYKADKYILKNYVKVNKELHKDLENLATKNKDLEEKNKHLSSTSDYETICLECNNLEEQLEIANDKIKELEIEISRIPYFNKCWDTIYEMAVKNFESKIIAKIEEIENKDENLMYKHNIIQVLEELLQEGK